MMNKILAGALAFGLVAGIAYAADDQASAQQQQGQQQAGPNDGQQGWFNWHRHGGHREMMQGIMNGPGPGGHGGPGMMGGMQGFHLQLGPNVNVGIMCGTQAMKDCIAEAQPLIDAAKAAAGAPK